MNTKIRLHPEPTRAYSRSVLKGEIPLPSYESALDTSRQAARTRFGMVCGMIIVALAQFAPMIHDPLSALLAVAPATLIGVAAFPLISRALKRDEARLKVQYGRRGRR